MGRDGMRVSAAWLGIWSAAHLFGCAQSPHAPHAPGEPPEVTAAYQYLQSAIPSHNLVSPRAQLVVVQSESDALGIIQVKFDHEYNGFEVFGSQVIVHLNPDLTLRSIVGDLARVPSDIALSPGIPVDRARASAKGERCAQDIESETLVLYPVSKTTSELAFRFNATRGLMRCDVFVSAVDGRILTTVNLSPALPK